MVIEYLFPEIGNLYGDSYNFRYLSRCLPDAEAVMTHITDEPAFLTRKVDFVYMGASSEIGQQLAADRLRPYKAVISAMIDDGTVFLCTGNALEIFGEKILNEDGTGIEGLGLFPIEARRKMLDRQWKPRKKRPPR